MAEATLTGVKIRPLGDRVLVRPIEREEKKKSGLIIPDTAKEKPLEGEVLAIGTGKVTDEGKILPINVKKGDQVLYKKFFQGTEIKIDNVEHIILEQDDILGIIEN